MSTKSFTSGLFNDLPTLSCISRCFCCALVLVGALLHNKTTILTLLNVGGFTNLDILFYFSLKTLFIYF